MVCNATLSLGIILFDLALLINMRFNHRSDTVYHRRMRHALVFVILSCIVDVAAAVWSMSGKTDAVNRARLASASPVLMIIHLIASVWVAIAMVVAIVMIARKIRADFDHKYQLHNAAGQDA